MSKKRIAIVYDWMDKWGGVERMLLTLGEMYPEAEWFTSYVDYKKAPWIPDQVRDDRLKTSFIQHLPPFIKNSRILSLPFYPYAFESFSFNKYDLVISVTSSFAKSVVTSPGTRHICILLTPTRWLWGMTDVYIKSEIRNPKFQTNSKFKITNLKSYLINLFINSLKRWDKVAAQRPDKMISISKNIEDRCQKYYHRESEVIYPPFDIGYWRNIKSEIRNPKFQTNSKFKITNSNFFLVVSRLEPYKKIDLVIRAFNNMPEKNLIIVGSGTEKGKLHKIAGPNIAFLENVSDKKLGVLYSQAQAVVMAQEEDFGYSALEAQFFGCPVIAYAKGGALETVVKGKTGVFFKKQTVGVLCDAVADFAPGKYNLDDTLEHLEKFSKEKFINKMKRIVKETQVIK